MDAPLAEFTAAAGLLGDATRWASAFAQRLASVASASKSDQSPVTAADLALQALLVVGLEERYGERAVVGEESTAVFAGGHGSDSARLHRLVHELVHSVRPELSASRIDRAIDAGADPGVVAEQWIIDPIDGTRGYLSGQQYCVCLAYLRDGLVQFGAAGCPRLGPRGRFVAAVRGRGTWVWEQNGPTGLPTRCQSNPRPRTELVACESPDASERARNRLRLLVSRVGGPLATLPVESQCKYVLVATGDADLAIRFPSRDPSKNRDSVWDYAGAVVMAEEAGAAMTDCEGKALRFGRGRVIEGNRGILCAAPWLHGPAIEGLAAVDRALDVNRPQAPSNG